jgi:hypothetical protein
MRVRIHSDITRPAPRQSGDLLIDYLRLSYAVPSYREGEDMDRPSYEIDSPHLNAPTWPWVLAGWTVSALHVLFFVAPWIQRSV